MKLLEQTSMPLVQAWAAGRQPAWSAVDLKAMSDHLIAIASAVMPHIVQDAALTAAETQQFLLGRAQAAIDVWLIRAAAGLRVSAQMGPLVRTASGVPALGLRSASTADLEGLDGVARDRAAALARTLALNGGITRIDDLDAVDGVGPATLKALNAQTYLDQPRAILVSPTLLAFAHEPTAASYLNLLDRNDIELCFGDANTLARWLPAAGGTLARWLRLLDLVQADAQRRISPASGTLASQAKRQLARSALSRRYVGSMTPTDGDLVVNEAYLQAMLDLIAAATSTLRTAHFVATATKLDDGTPGSLAIIEALEARAAAGLQVRVILDRDRPGDPYLSRQINRPVIERLSTAGVAVKQDDPATLLHSKLLVCDRSRALVGSHNLTTSSIARTHEVSVRLNSAPLAASYAARFDALWTALP